MSLAALTTLFASPLVTVTDCDCHAPRGGPGAERGDERTHFALVRRGAFAYHARGERHIAEPGTAVVYHEGDSYRISHPLDGGDRCTIIEADQALAEELLWRRGAGKGAPPVLAVRLAPGVQLEHVLARAALRRHASDRLAAEELVVGLLASMASQRSGRARAAGGRAAGRRRIVQRAQETIVARLDTNLGLADVAASVGCSPYHLARLFRDETGFSLRQYRLHLRLAIAMQRLADGDENLGAMAVDLGFSHHSHLTESFRRHVGVSPGEVRRRVRNAAIGSRPSALGYGPA
ncbi:MAG TPA: AraC family transcriptional regulator [Gemmatimonadaceae bacterium]